jgi:WD40 repeat protein
MAFKAFISYSHSADGKLAPAVQDALRGIAKPWYRLRTMRVFRDQTNLGASPGLWSSILAALQESEFFLFMASPTAAQSPWVQKEVDWWLSNRSSKSFLILLTEGRIVWDAAGKDFDWSATTALPGRLSNAFPEEPLYTELAWARTSDHLSLRHSQFRGAILDLAATLLHRPKDELDGEDVRQFRKTRRILWFGIVTLAVLLLTATIAAYVATQQRDLALSRALGASSEAALPTNPELALLLAQEAVHLKADDRAQFVLRKALARSPERYLHHAPSGKTVVAEFAGGSDFIIAAEPGARATVWSTQDGRRVKDLAVEVLDRLEISRSPDSAVIAIASTKGNFFLYDPKDWKTLAELPGKSPRFSTQGTWLAATVGHEIRLWDFPSLHERHPSIRLPDGFVLKEISPNGRWLYATNDFDSLVLSADSGAVVAQLPPEKIFEGPRFSPDSKSVLAVTQDDTAEFWDAQTGRKSLSLKSAGWVEYADFSPDGKTLVTGSRDGILRIWDIQTGALLSQLSLHSNRISRVQFSRDGAVILSVSVDGTACLWAVESRRCLVELGSQGDKVWDAQFAADGMHFLTTHLDGTVRVWSRERWYPTLTLAGEMAVSSSNGRVALTWASGKTRVWDISTGKSIATLEGSSTYEDVMALSPDGSLAAIAPSKGLVQMWNAATSKRMLGLGKSSANTTALAFGTDGKQLATGGSKGNIQFWSTQDGSLLKEWNGNGIAVTQLRFAPDGSAIAIATAADKSYQEYNGTHSARIQVRQLPGGNILREIRQDGGKHEVADIALSVEKHPVLLVLGEAVAQMWDTATGATLKTFAGHSDEVFGGAFSPDVRYVVTGSGYYMASGEPPDDGNEVRVWDVATGGELMRYRAATRDVQYVAFGSDATTVISASREGSVRIYRCGVCLPLPELLKLSSNYRALTADERARYVPQSNLLPSVFSHNRVQ